MTISESESEFLLIKLLGKCGKQSLCSNRNVGSTCVERLTTETK